MVEQLQGGVSLDFLKQDPDFLAAPPEQQKAYLQQYVLPNLDPDFAQAPPEEQNAYLDQYVLPNFIPNPPPQPIPPTQTPPPVSPSAVAQMPVAQQQPYSPMEFMGNALQALQQGAGQFGEGFGYGVTAGSVIPQAGVPQDFNLPFTAGDLLGALTAISPGAIGGAGGLAATGGLYSAGREANRQALVRGGGVRPDTRGYSQLSPQEQQATLTGVGSQGLLGALSGFVPASLGARALTRVATGAGLGGVQGVAQNALEQYADKGKVDIKETLPAALFGGVLGGGVGALGGKARPKELANQRQELPIVRRGTPQVRLETEARLLPQPQEPTPIGRVPRDVTEAIEARASKAINRPVQRPASRPAPAPQEEPKPVVEAEAPKSEPKAVKNATEPTASKPTKTKTQEAKPKPKSPLEVQRTAEQPMTPENAKVIGEVAMMNRLGFNEGKNKAFADKMRQEDTPLARAWLAQNEKALRLKQELAPIEKGSMQSYGFRLGELAYEKGFNNPALEKTFLAEKAERQRLEGLKPQLDAEIKKLMIVTDNVLLEEAQRLDAKPVVKAFEATEALGKKIEANPDTVDLPTPPSPRQAKIDAQVERYNKALANNDPIEQGGAARMIEAELALAIKNDGMDKAGFVKATKKLPKEVFDDIAKRLNCGG